MTVDNGLDLVRVEAHGLRQHTDRVGQVLRVLADDRDREGVSVLDEHASGAVVQDAARSTEGQRALVIVLRHLLELRVLGDLQHPEADRERGEHHDPAALQHGEPDGDTPTILSDSHMVLTVSGVGRRGGAPSRQATLRPP